MFKPIWSKLYVQTCIFNFICSNLHVQTYMFKFVLSNVHTHVSLHTLELSKPEAVKLRVVWKHLVWVLLNQLWVGGLKGLNHGICCCIGFLRSFKVFNLEALGDQDLLPQGYNLNGLASCGVGWGLRLFASASNINCYPEASCLSAELCLTFKAIVDGGE